MPDYGHPLRFGSFITPVNAPASAPVRLAVLSEELGLDLVTFQDHPYQASFLDTWTLLSWAGAHTERVQLSGNVLNLPLRQPAVLARSAASLDLLSGGRVSLGIGAGGLWDAIEAMGGRRLEPGQAVDALDEAIDVIRGIWDAADRRALRVEGDYYRVAGAKRGPAPAHEIPVWVGAYKSRMLRLVGRKADGWLPSLPHLQPGDLRRGNQVIDEAAAAAGRDPREIARLLNVTPRESADDLVSLALEEGISTFIVMGDDAAALLEGGASYFFQLRAVGGAVSDVPADATAYGWRDANFSVVAFGTRHSGLYPWWERLLPHMEGLYLSFESATGPEVVARAFPPRHLARLTELKRRYDPTGLFRDNFFIDPA